MIMNIRASQRQNQATTDHGKDHRSAFHGRPSFEIVPQVAIERGDACDWIPEDDISRERLVNCHDHAVNIKVACNSADEFQRLTGKLSALGVRLGEISHYDINSLSNERLQATVKYELSHPQARCVAKIAFNYMAWNFRPEFVLNESFDEIRAYIRHGGMRSCT